MRRRVVAHELVLGGAELLLPWPLPGTLEKGISAPVMATPAVTVPA